MKSFLIATVLAVALIGCKQAETPAAKETLTTTQTTTHTTTQTTTQTTVNSSATADSAARAIAQSTTDQSTAAQPTTSTTAPPISAAPAVSNPQSKQTLPSTGKTPALASSTKPAAPVTNSPAPQAAAPAPVPVKVAAAPASQKPADVATTLRVGSTRSMTLHGTSTLHDWTMTANAFSGTTSLVLSPAGQLVSISSLGLTVPVHNLKSESDGMNNNAYDALKSAQFPDIGFKLTSATLAATGANSLRANGNLTIAGATHAVSFTVATKMTADGSLSCSGSLPILLSDYQIERPSFMLGAMKVGNAMTLDFAVLFVK